MNVYQATQNRLQTIFSEFDNVYVSFSGGKDSGVLINLCLDYIKQNNLPHRLGVFHIDYEAQYQMTTDYVKSFLDKIRNEVDIFHICLPIAAQCATSMHQAFWTPWDKDKKDIWVRELPKNCVNEENNSLDFFKKNMWDYELQEKFSGWFHKYNNAEKTCCLVGIRTQESLNRWRAIHSDRNYRNYKNLNWTRKIQENVFNAYPIYDWVTEDVWIANYKNKWEYNKLYDLFYQAGLNIDQMRVASPFNDYATESLKMYRVIEPNTWAKMIGRVNGVNFTGIYGGTTAMGWKSIKLPPNHTWKSYMEFLISTLPKTAGENYKKKLETSQEFWRKRGGCLSFEVMNKLKNLGIEFKPILETNYKTDKFPVTMEYIDDIDIEEFKEIPTYKRMCICIMKNDHLCKYMGFSATKNERQIRVHAEKKYKNLKEKL